MRAHERWLAIAQEDLKAAKSLLRDGLFSSATYHCQQSAEKALKAYLAFKEQEIIKTHDLIKLGELCRHFDAEFCVISETLEKLNPFATKFRYPTEFDVPDESDVVLIVKQATEVVRFVSKQISGSGTGQMEIC